MRLIFFHAGKEANQTLICELAKLVMSKLMSTIVSLRAHEAPVNKDLLTRFLVVTVE